MSTRPPTRFPSSRHEEEPLLSIGSFHMSARQLGWVGMAILAWLFLGRFLADFIGLGAFLGYTLCSPLAIAGPVFAWGRVQGRPMEMWLADRLIFALEKRQYTMGEDTRRTRVTRTHWEDDDG